MARIRYSYGGGVLTRTFISDVKKESHYGQSKRGDVNKFSTKSATTMGRYLRCCVADYRYMVTLTYPTEPCNQVGCKSHLKRYFQRVNRFLHRKQIQGTIAGCGIPDATDASSFWFLEFQRNGNPHFHILQNYTIPKHMVSEWWFRIVGSGLEKHLKAGTRIERIKYGRKGTISYVKKYAKKQEQKELPEMFDAKKGGQKVGRWWGIVGNAAQVSAVIDIPCGLEAKNEHIWIAKALDEVLEIGLKDGKIKKMPYKLTDCYVTDDIKKQNDLLALIQEAHGDKQNANKMYKHTSQNARQNLYRKRRG